MNTASVTYAYSGRRLGIAVVVGVLACEPRHAPRPDTSVAAAVARNDTLVRRVTRVLRHASALQRVTGAVQARGALEPLDSALVVQVLDQRGSEIANVGVRSSMNAGDCALLRVVNATTDSAGLSRALFTPGRTADPQVVTAQVSRVGHIDFSVSIPPARIALDPERLTVWSDDDAVVAARLSDASGVYLPGGTVSWTSSDTSTVRVQATDHLHARVLGVSAGSANVVAWVGDASVRASAVVGVRPVLGGRFVTIDGGPVPPMRMEVRAGGVRDSIRVVAGQFRERIELPRDQDVEVFAVPTTRDGAYHDVHVRVLAPRQLQRLDIALVRTTWSIDAGTYRGREVKIDAARALRRSGGAGFWRLVPNSGTAPKKLLGWRESDLPLRLAFNRGRSFEPISAEDSVRFWSIAAQMESDMGTRLFVPGEMSGEALPGPGNLIPVEISAQSSEGHTFVAWTQSGDANDGVVLFRSAATLRDAHVVTHELLHLLGFGHTSAWTTVATPSGGREPRLTVEDVAYAQLAMRLRRVQQETGARPGLPVALP